MSTLQHKIDFTVILQVSNANPNGDPLNGNRPRTDYDGYGEITDVCLKRKIRNRLLERWVDDGRKDDGNRIFVQSDDHREDDAKSLRQRAELVLGKKMEGGDLAKLACEHWFDVRSFGQLFAFKGAPKAKKGSKDEGGDTETGVSIAIRGPVTVQSAYSVEPVEVISTQITKSVSSEGDGSKRGPDTMGTKHKVNKGIYVFNGSINPQLAERTGFSDADAEAIRAILPRMFENDESSARPGGSMQVLKVFWWKHNCKSGQYSAAKVHHSIEVNADGSYNHQPLLGLEPIILDGF
jgi:CRISPR-associated protein Csd2